MVLTMLDLQNFHLERTTHPGHYAYVFRRVEVGAREIVRIADERAAGT